MTCLDVKEVAWPFCFQNSCQQKQSHPMNGLESFVLFIFVFIFFQVGFSCIALGILELAL